VLHTQTPGSGSNVVPQLYMAGNVLVYAPALERSIRGCLDKSDFRAGLRTIFHLPTPPDEKGVTATLSKLGSSINKMGVSLTKGFF